MKVAFLARPHARYLIALGLTFTILQLLLAFTVPVFSGPDETEHRAYAVALLETHRLPVLATLPRNVTDADGYRIAVESRPTGLAGAATSQAQHPPLPYLAYAAVESVRLRLGLPAVWIRVTGLLWGWLTLLAFGALGRDLFADQPAVRDALPAGVLLPGPIYLSAMVSNDAAAMAAGAVILWRLLRGLRKPYTWPDLAGLGLALGLGLLTKSTLLVYLPVAAVVAWRWSAAPRSRWVGPLLVLACAILPVAWWWHHNLELYGTALVRADARPTLLSLRHTLVASQDLGADLYVLGFELGLATLIWWPTCLAPLWLLLGRLWLAVVVGALFWIPVLLCLLGPFQKGARGFTPTERTVRRACLVIFAMLFALFIQQFLYQDYLVAFYAGRYFLGILGALLVPLLLSWSARHGAAPLPAAAGRRLAVFAGLVTLAAWPVILHPPGP